MVSAKLNVLNCDSRMTPDFACILAIFACSGKTLRGTAVSFVLAQDCEPTGRLGDVPAQSPYVRRHGHHFMRYRFLALVPFPPPRVTGAARKPTTNGSMPCLEAEKTS